MTKVIALLAFFICCNTGGEITLTYAMKQVGEPEQLRPMALLRFLGRAFANAWFWVALPLCAASFYSLLVLLSWAPLSVVIPASAATYVVGTFGAKYILREQVSPKRWMGVLMVCIGVTLVLFAG
jgi:drug/metabolite transporter (DMT)-like permease